MNAYAEADKCKMKHKFKCRFPFNVNIFFLLFYFSLMRQTNLLCEIVFHSFKSVSYLSFLSQEKRKLLQKMHQLISPFKKSFNCDIFMEIISDVNGLHASRKYAL